ncbi:tetratricopeptide repeat protein [Argonema antarcticum]|uniref:tetratricopeptide repeat protein n=1 Tax=Argonema antarcticum TaxID=2942763 RepID=UPI0020129BDA|nr:tetratricopeptide repeat protein [Argonema antarcticum]MCL1470820.1 sel1 repeat family protein [Argonema antarcticum A004/B2]
MSDLEKGLAAFYDDDYTTALSLLKPLADEGNAEAQCTIANMYHLGLGVERNILEAIEWYVKSSERGYGVASNNLGGIYLTGDEGVRADRTEADKWFQKARDQGFLHTPLTSDYLKLTGVA